MKLPQNLGLRTRWLYVVVGLGLMALGLLSGSLPVIGALAVGLVGAIIIVEGAVGF